MLKTFYTVLALLCFSQLKSQNLEWINYVSGDSIDASFSKSSFPIDIAIDTENNSYLTGQFLNKNIKAHLPFMNSIIKYNEAGEMCWYKNFGHKKYLGGNAYVHNIVSDEETSDIYSLMSLYDSVKVGDSSFYFKPNYFTLALVKTDSAFNIKWLRIITDSLKHQVIPSSLIITKNNIYIQANTNLKFRFKGTSYLPANANDPLSQPYTMVLKLEKTEQGSSNEWATILYGDKTTGYNRLKIDGEGNAYCFWVSHDSGQIHINNTTLNGQPRFGLVKLNANNGGLNTVYPLEGASLIYNLEVTHSGKILASVTFDSTFQYSNQTFTSPINGNCLLLFLDNTGGLIWSIQEENSIGKGFTQASHSAYKNGNFYCSGTLSGGSTGFKGVPVPFHSDSSSAVPIFAKFDTLGNCLWAFADSKPNGTGKFAMGQGLKVDSDGNPIITGFFQDKVSLLDTSFELLQNSTNTLIFKLTDYSIYRGNVLKGPYCAGDNIDIPFTKKGKFKAGNEFIAQLSDENGEFNGKERELGKLKDTADGVIKGTVPLFNVNTGGKYRIRIVSTNPVAQSFYRQDTLRLLIYSRDTANAGNDTFMCKGQSVQLSTTGGTKWNWSPANSLTNATIHNPIATPETDTRYRIIISDSSGCGNTDTDYVWVRVSKPLNIEAPFTDTTLCKGQSIKLWATGAGGDSTRYIINWYEQQPNSVMLVKDSTNTITVISPQTKKTFYAVLSDNCSSKPDTLFYTISVYDKLKASFVVSPSRLEVDEPIQFVSNSQNAVFYQWSFNTTAFAYGNSDTTVIFPDSGFVTITLVAENGAGCKDTTFKTLRVFDETSCYIPNAFTPNSDKHNPVFAPVCTGVSNYSLTIYNRWGQEVYHAQNKPWQGLHKNKPVPNGIYIYEIKLQAENGKKSEFRGIVHVLR
jgi:gliding motility-associated-like protein